MKWLQKVCICVLLCVVVVSTMPIETRAALANIEGNEIFHQDKIPTGKTGKIMNVTFFIESDQDYEDLYVGIAYDDTTGTDGVEFPFELTTETTDLKRVGKVKAGQKKSVSISARVRRDIPEGYYGVPVYLSSEKYGGKGMQEFVNVYIKKSTTTDTDDEVVKDVEFELGQGQSTPRGTYPNVLNFSISMANLGKITALDVDADMVLDKDPAVFPFEINDVNYSRHFDSIATNESVSLDYSFAIRSDSYTGYYPIKLTISYRESSDGPIKSVEEQFFVHITSKSKDDETKGEFNANDRTRARIIIDSFTTVPEKIYAGEQFELSVILKNASSNVNASNILFSIESEKVSDSAVFTVDSGSSSVVVPTLNAGTSTELKLRMSAKAGADPRSYTITIHQKYDSPEYKNAEEKVTIDIPIYQKDRLNIGNIDITPASIEVGQESNVTFQINNTGKMILYNVTAKFAADSIKANETYVGNIKPGESGNVDVMLTGESATMDDGVINITITYENENAEISEITKEMTMYVTQSIETDDVTWDDTSDDTMDMETPWYKNVWLYLFVAVLLVVVSAVIIIKKKRANKQGEVDEIS